ncbi:hypothetical protein W02_18540 [Nitrospira sp. KM1]|uniref:hypothetical protein n=1 Tax=Nitrospira sp. KM1 TaxID=1936990 RepID=UPI0013A77B0C|nr:hypothetical protein [Nitrospira sp. KM1]BCA54714.1 hypothetical protein W02_18540 [Nitrospira sp. KM1]
MDIGTQLGRVWLAAVAFLIVDPIPVFAEAVTSLQLWGEAPAQEQPLPPKKAWVIREREIAFDPQSLAIMKDATARPHPSVRIELFQHQGYELDVTSTVSRMSNLSTVRGTLKSIDRSTWSLLINGNLVSGTIQIEGRQFRVEHVQNGRHRLLEIDPAKVPPD